ncbi:MAG: DNA cytosine methyltransferase [Trueperaceae bacterium]|nr:DNA cytosine methyltransferase [Trueperaceae bacterium]
MSPADPIPDVGDAHASDAHEHAVAGLGVRYAVEGATIHRTVTVGTSSYAATLDADPRDLGRRPDAAWFLARAKGRVPNAVDGRRGGRVRTVDLFSGSGGLSLGTRWAAEALGRRASTLLAVDVDPAALDVHRYNHAPRKTYLGSVRDLLTPETFAAIDDPTSLPTDAVTTPEASWLPTDVSADLLFGGPPCQGHSNLNNVTRRTDDRNQLYYWMALAAHAFRAKAVVVENVASVKADAGDVVGMTIDAFRNMGYDVLVDDVLSADRMGVAQTRRRHFLVAVRGDVASEVAPHLRDWLLATDVPTPNLLDVIGDLQDVVGDDAYDTPSALSEENQARIDHLFDHDLHDLPDAVRPASHRDGHTYPSVYGRMYADRPSGTLSTGFLTPGRGRYVHPTRRRTMTPHEGARVQGFPDDFRFVGASGTTPNRTSIARMVGDAVPPPMAFHVALATLASIRPEVLGTP